MLLTSYRLGLLAAAFVCLYFTTARRERERSNTLEGSAEILAAIRSYLPAAASLGPPEGEESLSPVLNADGEPVGWAAQTYPEAQAITGYSGPSNLLVVMYLSQRVAGVRMLESADTVGHVAKVVADTKFFEQWNGRTGSSLGAAGTPHIVSGASLTSEAMARGVAARFGAAEMGQWFPQEITVEDVRSWFPEAASISSNDVLSAEGKAIGVILRASRMNVAVRGFQGSSDVLVALNANKKSIVGVSIHASRDNEPYLSSVRDTLNFDTPYAGLSVDEILTREPDTTLLVSGASRTAEAVEETVREMLRRWSAPPPARKAVLGVRDGIALVWIAAGAVIGLTSLRGRKWARLGFAAFSVLVGGLWLGLMTGQDQWIKSAMRGSVAVTSIPLLALTASAILIPAAFGKNLYCAQLCPHGAAQQLLGALRKRRVAVPAKVHRVLVAVPWMTLGGLWLLAFLGLGFPFAHAEPFEIWSAGFIALAPVAIFFTGLVAAIFLPQAYCHYGCPTGAVLKFLASSPGRWTRRDGIAGGIVMVAWISFFLR